MAIKDLTKIKKHLFLCNGESCKLRGAAESTIAIRSAISERGLSEQIHTTKTLCNGRCKDGPVIISMPDGIWFKKMEYTKADPFVSNFLMGETAAPEDFLYQYGADIIQTE